MPKEEGIAGKKRVDEGAESKEEVHFFP